MKIRIAVAIDHTGQWNAAGWGGPNSSATEDDLMGFAIDPLGDGERRYWVEADIDPPAVTTVAGTAKEQQP